MRYSLYLLLFVTLHTHFPAALQAQEVCLGLDERSIEGFWPSTIEENAVLLDVRNWEEAQYGSIGQARIIDVDAAGFKDKVRSLELYYDQPLYVFCRTGRRSGQAVDSLLDMGFERIIWLNGGIEAWQKAHRSLDLPQTWQNKNN